MNYAWIATLGKIMAPAAAGAGSNLEVGVSGSIGDSTAVLVLENLNTTSGSLLVAFMWWNASAETFTSIEDSNTNSWSQVGTQYDDAGLSFRTYIAHNITGGAGHDFTATFSGTVLTQIAVVEIKGAATSSANDATSLASTTDAASPFTVTSGTLEQADECVIAVIAGDSGSNPATLAESTGFNIQQSIVDGTTLWCGGIATKIVSATTALTPSFTQSGSSSAILRVFGIKGS